MKTNAKTHSLIMMSRSVFMVMKGVKTQTRRVINPQPEVPVGWTDWRYEGEGRWRLYDDLGNSLPSYPQVTCGYGVVGNRILIREKWRVIRVERLVDNSGTLCMPKRLLVGYGDKKEEWRCAPWKDILRYMHDGMWKTGRFMPYWASRLTIQLIGISIQRLQDITQDDVRAEGVPETWDQWEGMGPKNITPSDWDQMDWRKQWATVWNILHAKKGHSWESNPWVFKLVFKKTENQYDQYPNA